MIEFIILVAIIVWLIYLITIQRNIQSKEIGRISIRRKPIVFATPHRIEMVLISLYFIFFFISDLAQNKVVDLGTDYTVILFWHMTALALDVWVIFLILFHLVLMAIFLLSLGSKATHHAYDVIVGVFAFFGVAILLSGVIVQIYSPTIHFLFMQFKSIDFYHLGVYMEILAGVYWVFTK